MRVQGEDTILAIEFPGDTSGLSHVYVSMGWKEKERKRESGHI
jgi:hypothetical protein